VPTLSSSDWDFAKCRQRISTLIVLIPDQCSSTLCVTINTPRADVCYYFRPLGRLSVCLSVRLSFSWIKLRLRYITQKVQFSSSYCVLSNQLRCSWVEFRPSRHNVLLAVLQKSISVVARAVKVSIQSTWAQYTPPTPTRRNCFVCVHEFATSSRRLPTDWLCERSRRPWPSLQFCS